LPMCFKLNLAR